MKTLIVDDHPIIRMFLKNYMEENFPDFDLSVIRSIQPSLPQDIIRTQANLVILDISLDTLDILDYFIEIKESMPNSHFIIYTMHNIASYKKFFWQNGASAYVLKEDAQTQLKEVIETVVAGNRWFPEFLNTRNSELHLNQLCFTDEERQLLSVLLETIDTEEILSKMKLPQKEVLDLRRKLLTKSGAKNTQQLLSYAIDYNWVR